MKNLLSLLNVPEKDGDVGIEIEVEGSNLPPAPLGWRKERDASLKAAESAEYVMRSPVPIAELRESLDRLRGSFKMNNAVIDDSYRAGIHTHINVQKLTIKQLMNFVALFLIMEECLVDYCAPSRRGNHFCLRAKDAEYFIQLLWRTCEEGNLKLLHTDDIRYSAMNLKSLFDYGSVEFRSLESTQDYEKIALWAEMLYNLREQAVKFSSPDKVMEAISGAGDYKNFVQEIMNKWFPIIEAQPGWQKKVRNGILNAQDFAFSRDWNAINLNIFQKGARFV
jgi:hypothetical protein